MLVREIIQQVLKKEMRVKKSAFLAMQAATEAYLTEVFEGAQLLVIHGKRVTVRAIDMSLYNHLMKTKGPSQAC